MAKPNAGKFKLTEADRIVMEMVGPANHYLFAQHYFGVELFPWQQYYLSYPAKNKLVVAGIRTGKSFVAAFALLHFAYWNPGGRVLNVCITSDQSQIIFNDIVMLASSAKFSHWVDKVITHPYPIIRLVNGSEIWCRSIGGPSGDASTLRGWEFDFINVDEAAYVTNEIAIRTLQGRLIGVNKVTNKHRFGLFTQTTTPKGAKTWLFERWKLGDTQYPQAHPGRYLSLRARTYDNPLLDHDLIEQIMENYTEKQKQQELDGVFLSDDGLFDLESLMRMCGRDYGSNIVDLAQYDDSILQIEKGILDDIERATGKRPDGVPQTIEHYELEPEPGHLYVAGWDLGSKTVLTGRAEGRNATVGVVYDITSRPWKQVAWRYDTQGRYSVSMERIKEWHLRYSSRGSTCHTRIDSLGPGDVVHQMLEEDRFRIDGFKASTLSKGAMLQASSVAIEKGWVRAPFIRRQVDQFQAYEPNDKNLAQDIVIACSQAIHLARELEGGVSDEATVVKAQHGSLLKHRLAARRRRTGWNRQ